MNSAAEYFWTAMDETDVHMLQLTSKILTRALSSHRQGIPYQTLPQMSEATSDWDDAGRLQANPRRNGLFLSSD